MLPFSSLSSFFSLLCHEEALLSSFFTSAYGTEGPRRDAEELSVRPWVLLLASMGHLLPASMSFINDE